MKIIVEYGARTRKSPEVVSIFLWTTFTPMQGKESEAKEYLTGAGGGTENFGKSRQVCLKWHRRTRRMDLAEMQKQLE